MKKKMLCLALTATMALGMSTSAFAARLGSGDVNGDGYLTAPDAAAILQRVLDDDFNGSADTPFDVTEANFSGDSLEDGGDKLTAVDAQLVLNEALNADTSVYLIVDAQGFDQPLREAINEQVLANGDVKIVKTKVLDFVNEKVDAYDAKINDNVGKINNGINGISFNGVNIREDAGWAKFADAVAALVSDESALAQVGDSLKTPYTSSADVKAAFEAAKVAFAPGKTADDVRAAAEKVLSIADADTVVVTTYDENGAAVKTMDLQVLFETIAEEDLQNYDTVTFNKIQEIFGQKFDVAVKNPKTGAVKTVSFSIVRE
jgi:hypothetical protein